MGSYNPFYVFPGDFLTAKHNFSTDEFRLMLTNTEPEADLDQTTADISEIAAGFGYTAGGAAVTVSLDLVGNEWVLTGTPVVFEAAGGTIGPFEFAVLYNYTHVDQPVIAYWPYDGGSTSLLDTEQITLVPSGTGVFRVTQS